MKQKKIATILFADIANSSDISNHLNLYEYDEVISEFQLIASKLATYFTKKFGYRKDEIEFSTSGDEARLFTYSGSEKKDTECSILFAILLKIWWLVSKFNIKRTKQNKAPEDLGIGINRGIVVYTKHPGHKRNELNIEGYAINLAKRIETYSREGRYFKVMVDPNFYQACTKHIPYFNFAQREEVRLKGISQPIPIYEAMSFYSKMIFDFTPPAIRKEGIFRQIQEALDTTYLNSWIGLIMMRYYTLQKKPNKAIALGHKLFHVDSGNKVIPLAIAKSYESLGIYDRAIFWMERAAIIDRYDYIIHSYLGDLYSKIGNNEKAIEQWSIALSSHEQLIWKKILIQKIKRAKKRKL